MIKLKFFSFLFLCLAVQSLVAQSNRDSILRVKTTTDFQFTGTGSEENWKSADWVTLTPRTPVPAGYTTQIKILYSTTGIYCLYQSADKTITATLKEDFADLYNEDVIEAFFWPDEKNPLYFEYELSPLNYELAILVPNNKGNFFGWRPWHYEGDRKTRHAAKIRQGPDDRISGWTAEFFIPFALLRGLDNNPPKKGTRWRANFYRIDYDSKMAEWSWQNIRTNFHDYEMYGTIVFE